MKFLIRKVLLIAIVSLSAGALFAAGQSEDKSETQSGEREFVTLVYVLPQPNGDMSREKEVEAHLNKYLKEKLNCEIDFIFTPADQYYNKISLMASSGESFDLMMGNNSVTQLSELVSKRMILPLDDLLNNYGQGIMAKIEDRFWPAVEFDGKKMAVTHPFVSSQPTGLTFQKSLADKYNFDTTQVKELKDIEPFLAAVKAGEENIIPLYPNPSLLSSSGEDRITDVLTFYSDTNELQLGIDNPSIVERFKLVDSWYRKGYIQADIGTVLNEAAVGTDAMSAMQSGTYAVGPDAGAHDATAEKSTKAYGYPTYEAFLSAPIIGTNAATICGTAISATSNNPERAMEFINLLYSDKWFFNEVCFGEEGVDYTIVTPAEGDKDPVYKSVQPMRWAIWHPWIGSLWDEYGGNWNSTAALETYKEGTDKADVSDLLGFTFNSSRVKNEVAQLTAIWNERKTPLYGGFTGDVDKYIAETRAMMERAGLDTVVSEINTQIAAWKKANS